MRLKIVPAGHRTVEDVARGVLFVGSFQFEGQLSKPFLDFHRLQICALPLPFGVKPVQAKFIDLQVRIVHQEGLRIDAFAIAAAGVEKVERSILGPTCRVLVHELNEP